jgi:hypothetical protein
MADVLARLCGVVMDQTFSPRSSAAPTIVARAKGQI